ncbi:coiled-coil domain-containing protein [Micromonosporaceae bacterium Da 78-11]
MRHKSARRRLAAVLALIVAVTSMAVATSSPALAAPGDDGEGGSKSLVEQLDAASRGYLEAKDALARSKKRQTDLVGRLKQLDIELGPRQAALDEIIQQSYRTGRLGPMSALLGASTTGGFLDRAETLQTVAVKENAALLDLKNTRTSQERAKLAIDAEIRDQQKQVNLMARKKVQAETALKAANRGQDADEPGDSSAGSGSAKAKPAPRDSDGSLPSEGCSVNDPTTSGCITPRLLNAMNQAQDAGFTRFVACFRHQNSGEHPKGRACDFAADKKGFGGVATGSSKDYGTRLANYFIGNSDRLGVLYVIWFRRIWLPSSGWKSYSGGNGDPSSDHTNHVHLSVR